MFITFSRRADLLEPLNFHSTRYTFGTWLAEQSVLATVIQSRIGHSSVTTMAVMAAKDLWLMSEGHCFRDQVLQVCGRAPSVPQAAAQFKSGSLETLVRLVTRRRHKQRLVGRLSTPSPTRFRQR